MIQVSKQCLGRLVHWLFYGVIITAIPLVAKYIGLLLRQIDPTLVQIISHGELIIISVSVLAASIGEVAAWEPTEKLLKKIVLGVEIVLLCLCCMTFADISNIVNIDKSSLQTLKDVSLEVSKNATMQANAGLQSVEIVVSLSLIFFICALLTSICGIILSERES